ncbi:MAG: hypothetical protein JRG96_17510 [Deltaproteobacteria bacterium]|nr:hypothetical protein [Deltaproteobacteria bacterium]MBW2418894.1 hypothetical protein [Deltaproteobacteria bacterium]
MNIDSYSSLVSRLFFAFAFGLLGIAVVERVVFAFGYTILGGVFSGGRLLEIAAVVLVFVIALLLRQIREQLKASSG